MPPTTLAPDVIAQCFIIQAKAFTDMAQLIAPDMVSVVDSEDAKQLKKDKVKRAPSAYNLFNKKVATEMNKYGFAQTGYNVNTKFMGIASQYYDAHVRVPFAKMVETKKNDESLADLMDAYWAKNMVSAATIFSQTEKGREFLSEKKPGHGVPGPQTYGTPASSPSHLSEVSQSSSVSSAEQRRRDERRERKTAKKAKKKRAPVPAPPAPTQTKRRKG